VRGFIERIKAGVILTRSEAQGKDPRTIHLERVPAGFSTRISEQRLLGKKRATFASFENEQRVPHICQVLADVDRHKTTIRRAMKRAVCTILVVLIAGSLCAQEPRTELTKWQDGKQAAVTLTFDDSTENQFRIAMPLLNQRGLHGTFFIITGEIEGSRYWPTLISKRPIMEIIRESEHVPTTKENVLERTTMLRYLAYVQNQEILKDYDAQVAGRAYAEGRFDELLPMIDGVMMKLRQSGVQYELREHKPPDHYNRPPWSVRQGVSWEEFRRYAAQGHEFASHSVSHPYFSSIDEANNVYEIEKSLQEIREKLGPEHTFSLECPHALRDERIGRYMEGRVEFTRNCKTLAQFQSADPYMDFIANGEPRDPGSSKSEYVQWQHFVYTRSPLEAMDWWIDTTLVHRLWLVLTIHGFEGVGWESIDTDRARNFFDYISDRQSRLWVPTFQEGIKYIRERMHSKVSSRRAGEAIEVSVSHSLDPKLYNLPLTARTTIPNDWKTVRFRQGTEERWLPIHREGGETSVLYRIIPDGSVATLEKGLE
jgi:peptidoglycan/xylan/chitin deacetylase (PgdA/CDA1 family)